jgi:hypothetical protein
MKKFINKLLSFVANTLRSEKSESSKRLFGAIGFLASVAFIGIWVHDLIEELMYVSVMLLGLETVANLFKKK